MARVEWHPKARLDAERLVEFLQEKSPEAAARAARVIAEGARLLASSPHLGRPLGDGTERRALSLSFGSGAYILNYTVDYVVDAEEFVLILRVWHSREQRPS